MSQKYEKLKVLLKELFQLDKPDLDFWQSDPEWFGDPFIQACVDGLQKNEVVSIEWFRGGRR